MPSSIDRAVQLYQLHKYSMAIKELDSCLSENPEWARAHALKALTYIKMKKSKDSLQNAQIAVSLGPDDDFNHYALSQVYLTSFGDYEKAESSVKEALRINPSDPDYYDILAQLKMVKNNFSEALKIIDHGLRLNAEHEACLSTKAEILARIGNKKEAVTTARRALKKNPENPASLASLGYVRLQTGDYQGAQEAFKDALKLNPEYEYARNGMAQALKARHFFFRQFLNFSHWYTKIGSGWRWGIYIGMIAMIRAAQILPFLYFITIPYILFALSSWFVDPVFNLFLRFDKYGKYALYKNEIVAVDIMAGCFILAVLTAISGLFLNQAWLYAGAGALFLFSIPVTRTGAYYSRKPVFRICLIFSIIIAVFIVFGLISGIFKQEVGMSLLIVSIIIEVLFTFVAGMIIK
jgi:tetratricopeptide (TPR) repeat protein